MSNSMMKALEAYANAAAVRKNYGSCGMEEYGWWLTGLNDAAEFISGEGVKTPRVFLGNALSLQMVASPEAWISMEEVQPEDIPEGAISAIGHPDTARIVSGILGREIPCQRINIRLEDGDVLYVAQLMGGRLPEGATTLPEGYELSFRKVVVRTLQ